MELEQSKRKQRGRSAPSKSRNIREVVSMLKKRYIIKDVNTARRTKQTLSQFETKEQMLHSLSAVLSGEETIATYNREHPDETSKQILRETIEEKLLLLDDFEILTPTKCDRKGNPLPNPQRDLEIAAIRQTLGKCETTMGIDIALHDLIRGKITLKKWISIHTK